MMTNECTLEIFVNGQWRPAATLTLREDVARGCKGKVAIMYLVDYVADFEGLRDAHSLFAGQPVSFDLLEFSEWPAFLVDLLPQGYGRQELSRRLNIDADSPASDWLLLCHGAGNPIGNLRVTEAVEDLRQQDGKRRGFAKQEIADRSAHFIEYLAGEGFYVAGSSGIQGEWPKVLMTQDRDGLWHLDHLLEDRHATRHCIVKFTKGEKPVFERILQLEHQYYAVAHHLGLVTHQKLEFVGSALFIDRFDRKCVSQTVDRFGQESLYSLTAKGGPNPHLTHNEACAAIARFCTDPVTDVIEYVLRDVANVALGNKDNHGRNTAFQRMANGAVRLSPLFDFAPMYLHPSGIARRIRWKEHDNGAPEWASIAIQAAACFDEQAQTVQDQLFRALADFSCKLAGVPAVMAEFGVENDVLAFLKPHIEGNVARLDACGGSKETYGQTLQTIKPK